MLTPPPVTYGPGTTPTPRCARRPQTADDQQQVAQYSPASTRRARELHLQRPHRSPGGNHGPTYRNPAIKKLIATASTRPQHILPAALYAAALAATFGVNGTANAAPQEWDIGAYDECTAQAKKDAADGILNTVEAVNAAWRQCCRQSGGVVTPDNRGCQAPPYQQEVRPGVIPPGGLPTLTAVPTTPTPGNVTLTPAPIIGG